MSQRAERILVAAAAIVGPLFVVVVVAQALTRTGFDLSEHPLSLLMLGDLGWIQSANFIGAGATMAAFGIGLRRARPGAGWAPPLITVFGLGLILAGVFAPDPSLGFPPGAPEGTPDELSTTAMLHGLGFTLAIAGFTLACLALARRDATEGDRAWAGYSSLSAVATLVLAIWPTEDGASVRFFVATIIAFAWTSAVAVRLRSAGASLPVVVERGRRPDVGARA